MKKSLLSLSVFLSIIIVLASSCKKEDTDTDTTTVSFTWQEDGGAVITADSSFWTTGTWGTGIRAYKGGMVNFFEINWDVMDNTSVGTKALNTPYGFTFIKGSDTYTCTTNQSINITGNTSNTLSGNFNVPVSGSSITNISATFKNIPKR